MVATLKIIRNIGSQVNDIAEEKNLLFKAQAGYCLLEKCGSQATKLCEIAKQREISKSQRTLFHRLL